MVRSADPSATGMEVLPSQFLKIELLLLT